MNVQQAELYQRIQAFSLDNPDANLPFSKRLARDNGWSAEYTQRVIEEYKKFTFLAAAAGHPVTPSDQVDQVWHLHLLYTHSYWGEFCPNVLQTPLHHGPTRGGRSEHHKFNDWYSKTLASYKRFFGHAPPADIWPSPYLRFDRDIHFVRMNTRQNWILPKPSVELPNLGIERSPFAVLLFVLALTVTGCGSLTLASTSISWLGETLAGLAVVVFLASILDSMRKADSSRSSSSRSGRSRSSSSRSSSSWSDGCGGDLGGGIAGGNDASCSDGGDGSCGDGGGGDGGCGGGGCGGCGGCGG